LAESLLGIKPKTAIKASSPIKTLINRRFVPKVRQFYGFSLSSHLAIYCFIMIAFSHIFHPFSPQAPHFSLHKITSSFNFVD
jgi:hypothetical protein